MVPSGIQAELEGNTLRIYGPKGELSLEVHPHLSAVIAEADGGKWVKVALRQETREKKDQALWGLYGSLIRNMMKGVQDGWSKQLELIGVGFKVAQKGESLELEVGFSHPVNFPLPKGISAKVEKNIITISGADKRLVGDVAARLRAIKPPEPYKGKGIKYINEVIRRKAGKAAKAGTAAK